MPGYEKYRLHYTYEDYCNWEDNWELIEGMPYAMSPSSVPVHQRVSMLLSIQLEHAVKKCKRCKVYPPLDWKIQEDTIVQPDLLIVCNETEKGFSIPPVLVVEILSPATASKDQGEKMELYQSQQVKYYLIVDPQFKKVAIYECLLGQYQPVAINPDIFEFSFTADCSAAVNLLDIWD